MLVESVPFHGIHPSEVHRTGEQQLSRKMNHKMRHYVEEIWRKYPLKFTHDINDLLLHNPKVRFPHFPCAYLLEE